jgi:WD40 repeat protein
MLNLISRRRDVILMQIALGWGLTASLFFTDGRALADDASRASAQRFAFVGKVDGAILAGRPFSPDGRSLLVAMRGRSGVVVIDSHTLQPMTNFLPHASVMHASFINEGKGLFTAGGTTACFWDVHTSRLLSSVKVSKRREVSYTAVTSDGKRFVVVNAPNYHEAQLWHSDQLKPVALLEHTAAIRSIEFARGDTCVFTWQNATPNDPLVHLWDAKNGEELSEPEVLGQEALNVHDAADAVLDPGGSRVLVAEKEGTFSIVDLKSGKQLAQGEIRPPEGETVKIAHKFFWSPAGDMVFVVALSWGLDPGNVQAFDSRTGESLTTFAPQTWSLVPFPDGKRAVCVRNEPLPPVICDVSSGRILQTLSDGDTNREPFISRAGDRIAMSDHLGVTYVWELVAK